MLGSLSVMVDTVVADMNSKDSFRLDLWQEDSHMLHMFPVAGFLTLALPTTEMRSTRKFAPPRNHFFYSNGVDIHGFSGSSPVLLTAC